MIKTLLQNWVGNNLPLVHVSLKTGFRKAFADLFYHPIKRRIAKYYILFLRKFGEIKIIAITGSAGKTTTKEMLSSILSLEGKTVFSEGNIDPVFNIPKTILKCGLSTKYLVLEFGVEYPNEMDYYLWLVRPDIGVITNIFPTHTLYFKNRIGVLEEKSKLVKNTKVSVLNSDDKYLNKLKLTGKVLWFKMGKDLLGSNSNAATAVARVLKINNTKIKVGLANYKPQKHRLSAIKHKSDAIIIDDTYNSNPEALIASIKYFNKVVGNGKRILVVGDMLELGDLSVSEHKRVGKFIKENNFLKVYGVGKLVKYITPNVLSIKQIRKDINKYLKPNHYILIKGSRSIGLDRLVDMLV